MPDEGRTVWTHDAAMRVRLPPVRAPPRSTNRASGSPRLGYPPPNPGAHGDQGPSASLIRSGTDAPHARTGEDSSPSSSPASHHVAGRRSRIIVALRVRLPARPPHAPHSSGSPSLGYPCQWIPWHLDARVRGHHSSGRALRWEWGVTADAYPAVATPHPRTPAPPHPAPPHPRTPRTRAPALR